MPANYGYLIGLFPVNLVHSLYHLAAGLWGLAAFRRPSLMRAYLRAAAVTLGAFTVMGLLLGVNSAFGLMPLYGHDVWLHGLEAAGAAYLGFLAPYPADPSPPA